MIAARWGRTSAAAVLAAAALGMSAGCVARQPAPTAQPVPTFASSESRSATSTTSVAVPRLPADCGTLITTQNVDLALGQPLVGRVRGIVGVPEPKIKRLERITCQYGLPDPPPAGAAPPIPLEISVSRYADEASAAERLNDTIESERARGAAPTTVPVGPVNGTVLVTADRRLLVAASGALTVAITIAPGLADDRVADVLSELGGRVMASVT